LAAGAPGHDLDGMLGVETLASEDRSPAGVYVPAMLAGVGAAVAGGVAWGLIVKWTDYEIGFAAWGIGFLTGIAVLWATRGTRGLPFQAIAVVCALLGILIGKYLGFAWIVQEVADQQTGGAASVPVLSGDTVDLFRDELGLVFDWIDLLWAGLAVYTAWRTLQPEEPKPVEAQNEVERPA
jgi:hypothetical protein